MIRYSYLRLILLMPILVSYLSSCFGSKPVAYFTQGVIDTAKIQNIKVPEQVIQKGDLLNITIYSDNPDATTIYNQAGGISGAGNSLTGVSKAVNTNASGTSTSPTYLVDNDGNITLHGIGTVNVEGMTKGQLGKLIVERLEKLGVLTNPYCIIRFNNFKVTILGEVRSPGVFTLPSEKASILEALALAGDITDFGLKDRVLLIREVNGKRTYKWEDLTNASLFDSDDFYLRQNDVLVVQADSKKPTALDQLTLSYIAVGATVVSSIAILITLFR